MAEDHLRLVDDLERRGPDALREHLRDSARAVLAQLERPPG
jgi:DNA-binding GntR family transcriptional regulator